MSEVDVKKRRIARLQMILILAFAFLPFVAAHLLFWNPGGYFERFLPKGVNTKGAEVVSQSYLLEQAEFPGRLVAGAPVSVYGMWSLLQVIDGPCDTVCVEAILYQRQLYLTQGRHFESLQPVVLFTDEGFLPQQGLDFGEDVPMMSIFVLDKEQRSWLQKHWVHWFAEGRDGLVLLDRRGRSALYFERNLDPTAARKDLARIMRLNNS